MGLRELLQFLLPAASLKWWPVAAATIHGQKGGLAALEADSCSSIFVLCERSFHCLGLALNPPVQPSSFVHGCYRGGADLRQFIAAAFLELIASPQCLLGCERACAPMCGFGN
jgi:hypothetical protein